MRLIEKDGYILAVFTGLLYLMAFFNILAKANFYNVPLEMMSFDFFQLTRAAISILMFLLGVVLSVLIVLWLSTAKSRKSKFLYFVLMVFLVPLLFFFYLNKENETASYIMSALLMFISITMFFVTTKFRQIDFVSEFINSDYKDFLSLVRVKIFLFGLVFSILIITTYVSSYANAKWNSNYDVFTKGGDYALINASADSVIVKKVINKKLSDGFYIFKIEDLNNVEVRNRDIRELPRNDSTQSTELPAGFL
ncbi:hypothetical protein ACB496_11640 [Lelliottia nimipressuralis]|uniref:hypothetical protein n=1 Tax=Lelliottia nimipressuralis TaxID=69220 RepID=UPI003558958D